MGKLQKLSIARCKIEGGKICSTNETFKVLLNPTGFSHGRSISYSTEKSQGSASAEPKFSRYGAETVNIDLVIDGTGVVGQGNPMPLPDVTTQVKKLKHIVYDFDGSEHEPSVVHLLWGTTTFYGRLKAMAVEYTLFKPSGDPLRAKVKLTFESYTTKKEEALRANRSSPDLSHVFDVDAGDTLPLLCYRVYKDSSYYPEVATFNNLTDFRDIQPGVRLHFPPLR